jgi:hypothetical protein
MFHVEHRSLTDARCQFSLEHSERFLCDERFWLGTRCFGIRMFHVEHFRWRLPSACGKRGPENPKTPLFQINRTQRSMHRNPALQSRCFGTMLAFKSLVLHEN